MSASSLSCVLAWLDAVNNRDVERVIELSDPNIEILGPRGIARGHQILRDWMDHAWLELKTIRTFERGTAVVVEQHGTWRDIDSGDVIGERNVASRFRVADGHIALYARHDNLQEALAEAGMENGERA